jgi:ribosomal silencing factor RsfS
MITPKEIKEYLEKIGAQDVRIVPINGKLDTFVSMVVATGSSTRLLRQYGETIVKAVSNKQLFFLIKIILIISCCLVAGS